MEEREDERADYAWSTGPEGDAAGVYLVRVLHVNTEPKLLEGRGQRSDVK